MNKVSTTLAGLGLMAFCIPAPAAQRCALDLNDDHQTTVDELLVAVNEALTGCDQATPTPSQEDTACPYRFGDRQSTILACEFTGTFCGLYPVTARIQAFNTPDELLMRLSAPQLLEYVTYTKATVLSPTSARISKIGATLADLASPFVPAADGTLTLDSNGSTLTVHPTVRILTLDTCPFGDIDSAIFQGSVPIP